MKMNVTTGRISRFVNGATRETAPNRKIITGRVNKDAHSEVATIIIPLR